MYLLVAVFKPYIKPIILNERRARLTDCCMRKKTIPRVSDSCERNILYKIVLFKVKNHLFLGHCGNSVEQFGIQRDRTGTQESVSVARCIVSMLIYMKYFAVRNIKIMMNINICDCTDSEFLFVYKYLYNALYARRNSSKLVLLENALKKLEKIAMLESPAGCERVGNYATVF